MAAVKGGRAPADRSVVLSVGAGGGQAGEPPAGIRTSSGNARAEDYREEF